MKVPLLLLLSRFSHAQLCATNSQQHTRLFYPWDSPGKNTGMAQSCSILCNPMKYTVHGILQARILECVAVPFPRGSSQSRYWTQVSHIAGEPPGKPKNTGVGNLLLLQGIFLTQELIQDLLHCRQILYQLSYQGSHEHYGCLFSTLWGVYWEIYSAGSYVNSMLLLF